MAVVAEPLELDRPREPAFRPPDRRRLGLEQATVLAGQFGAGVGNLAFTLVAARLLVPAEFARLSVFLGLYLVLSLPATSLSATTALAPARRDRLVARVATVGVATAVAVAALSPWIGAVLQLPVAMVLVLAAAVPAAGLLALERGRLYGRQDHFRVVVSLLAEPAVRLSIGTILAVLAGAVGAAAGVVLAAYVALEAARTRRRRHSGGTRAPVAAGRRPAARAGSAGPGLRGAGWTAAAFALLALVQNQDLIFANAILGGRAAGLYAALSTLGGTAAFATITIPLVLLPRAAKGQRNSLGVAVGTAGVIGAAAVAIGALGPGLLVRALFGARYMAIAHLVVPYLGAMALLGVARVLVADRCASGSPATVTGLVGVAAAAQAATIAVAGRGLQSIALSTLATTAGLTLVLGTERLVRGRSPVRRLASWSAKAGRDPAMRVLALTVVVGLVLRLIVWRGIWLDEATSVQQVHMGFSAMLKNLRDTDVHPPLYFTLLWATVRVFGYGSMAIRLPSIAAGLLVIPAVYVAARDLWDRRTGLVAAALASVGPILVWYSQEVRMYSLFMLFAVLAIWGQTRALRRGRPADWAIYVLASAGLAWTEYFGLFQIVAQQAFFLWIMVRPRQRSRDRRAERRLLTGWLTATVILITLMLPLAPFAWHQFAVNQNAGKGFGAPSQTTLAGTQSISVYTVLANLAWAAIGYHSASIMEALVALWPLGILLTLFILGRRSGLATKLVLTTAVVPAVLLLAAGMEKRFLYDVRYMSGVAVALLLLGSRLVTGATRSARMQVMGCAALVAVLTAGLVDEQFNGTNPRLYDFNGALGAVDARWQAGDALVFAPGSIDAVLKYYAPRIRAQVMTSTPPVARPGGSVFVLASSTLMSDSDTQHLRRTLSALRQTDVAQSVVRKSNVTVWEFAVPDRNGTTPPTAPASLTTPAAGSGGGA